ncbi:MAG: hypothetical protein NTW26_06740 [bacterium]|nr:hypothetical protein [bacterium]
MNKPLRLDLPSTTNGDLFRYVEEKLTEVFHFKLSREEIARYHEMYTVGYGDDVFPKGFFLAMGTYEEYLHREKQKRATNAALGMEGFDLNQALSFFYA